MAQRILRRARLLGALTLAGCLSVSVTGCAAGDDGTLVGAETTAAVLTPSPDVAETPTAAPTPAPDDSGADIQLVEIQVADGQVSVAADRVEVALGAQVRLAVTSDTADELHVHGYDHSVELVPGRQATLELTADTPGLFDVELHESGLLLVQLEVR